MGSTHLMSSTQPMEGPSVDEQVQSILTKNTMVVGVDEAGRGCMMGPVYAAAVILPQTRDDPRFKEIRDSKLISEKKRYELEAFIQENAVAYGVGSASPEEIDTHNIYQATSICMERALVDLDEKLKQGSNYIEHVLVDGNHFNGFVDREGDFVSHTCVIKGDQSVTCISAASILAKCARDRHVIELCKRYPKMDVYHLSKNKGYGTSVHMQAIREVGISVFHRKTFGLCKTVSITYDHT